MRFLCALVLTLTCGLPVIAQQRPSFLVLYTMTSGRIAWAARAIRF